MSQSGNERNPIINTGRSEEGISLPQLANSDVQIIVDNDFLFPEEYEQIGAIKRKKALAHGHLVTTADLAKTQTFKDGCFILGRSIEHDLVQLGEGEDQELQAALLGNKSEGHVIVTAETRCGKGVRFLIPTLCTWPGSAMVIDPKGELASVTAERRGEGNEYCVGLKQTVFVLDPHQVSSVPGNMFARFNPLSWLSVDDPEVISKARTLADALIPDEDISSGDTYWKDEGRDFLSVIMVHVATDPDFLPPRTLNTVFKLLQAGDEENFLALQEDDPDTKQTAMGTLLDGMVSNPVLDGYVSNASKGLRSMFETAIAQWMGIVSQSRQSLSWVEGKGMKDNLSESTFSFDRLRNEKITVYVTAKKMSQDWRWLRMLSEIFLEDCKGKQKPAFGDTLFVIDEFPQLKYMKTMEDALPFIAGFGVRMVIVVQNLPLLKSKYPKTWDTFYSSSSAQIYFAPNTTETTEYISKQLGHKQETIRTRSLNVTANTQENHSSTINASVSAAHMSSRSSSVGGSDTTGSSTSSGDSVTNTKSANNSRTKGFAYKDQLLGYAGARHMPLVLGGQISRSNQHGQSDSTAKANNTSRSNNTSTTNNWNNGESSSDTNTETKGTAETEGTGSGKSASITVNEQHHKVLVLSPEDIVKHTAVIDDEDDERFPGQCLVILRGGTHCLVRTLLYYRDDQFYRKFSKHPKHPFIHAPKPYHLRIEQAKIAEAKLVDEAIAMAISTKEKLQSACSSVFTISVKQSEIDQLYSSLQCEAPPIPHVFPPLLDGGIYERGQDLFGFSKDTAIFAVPKDVAKLAKVRFDEQHQKWVLKISLFPVWRDNEEFHFVADLKTHGVKSVYFNNDLNVVREHLIEFEKTTMAVEEQTISEAKTDALRPFNELKQKVLDYEMLPPISYYEDLIDGFRMYYSITEWKKMWSIPGFAHWTLFFILFGIACITFLVLNDPSDVPLAIIYSTIGAIASTSCVTLNYTRKKIHRRPKHPLAKKARSKVTKPKIDREPLSVRQTKALNFTYRFLAAVLLPVFVFRLAGLGGTNWSLWLAIIFGLLASICTCLWMDAKDGYFLIRTIRDLLFRAKSK